MPAAERYNAPPPPPPLLLLLPSLLLISCLDGAVRAAGEGGGGLPSSSPSPSSTSPSTSTSASSTDTSSSSPGDNGLSVAVGDPSADSQFALRVLVRDAVTRRPLPGASVDVYVNHTLRGSARAGERGDALLRVAFGPGAGLTLLGSMRGYVPSPVPWSAARRPVFSAVTLPLLPHSQGNVWLFEDSVLIAGKLPDGSSQAEVTFPKDLLAVPDRNISSVTAYLTAPRRDCGNCTRGVVGGSRSALRSVVLRPAAAVCVLLYSGGEELQVRGPVHLSLPLGHGTRLRAADTLPAWAFDPNTGAWENQGLGIVKKVGGTLVWTYTASHLGYWIAAPLPSSDGHPGRGSSLDFLSHHTYVSLGILGGTLAIVTGLLTLMLCHCSASRRGPPRRTARFSKLTVLKKDQTTSTHMEEGLLFGGGSGGGGLASCSAAGEPSSTPRHKANFNIYVEDPGSRPAAPYYENIPPDRTKGPQAAPPPHYINGEEVARLREKSEQSNASAEAFYQDKLVHIYNQPVAIIQAPELFGATEQGCKSATFPRNGAEYDGHAEPAGHDGYAQTLPKAPHHHSQGGGSPQRSGQDEPQPLETPPEGQGPDAAWGRYSNLLESSVSVPGTLNEAAGMEAFSGGHHGAPGELQGISERTLLELTRGKPLSSHPRAWFVSLDGKPAAQVRHSIIELHGRHRPPSSNDTSLDSGVDMNEPLQSVRDRRALRASSLPHRGRAGRYGEEPDLSSSESGTTAAGTPEDASLRSVLDGSVGAIPNIPEERDTSSGREDSEPRETPPPRRLRKAREKGKADKRGAKQVREGRPLTKRS